MQQIMITVSREFGLPPSVLRSTRRTRTMVIPRHVAMYLAAELLGLTLNQIAYAFGHRDHTTILHAIKTLPGKMQKNPKLGERVERLRKQLLEVP